jgi:pimeloyl-ACP methyl ester carboxylesterase
LAVIENAHLELGYRESGAGEPVVLLHSTGFDSGQWRGVGELLAADFRVLAPDLPGYGESRLRDGGMALAHDLLAVGALLRHCGRPAHLVGHSYGGLLALHLALEEPRRLASLTLIEPMARGVLQGEDEAAARAEEGGGADFLAAIANPDIAVALQAFVDYWNGRGAFAAMGEEGRAKLLARGPKMMCEVAAVEADANPAAAYAGLELPTLLLSGSDTRPSSSRICELIGNAVAGARHQRITGAGHLSPLSHAAEVAALIAGHVRGA